MHDASDTQRVHPDEPAEGRTDAGEPSQEDVENIDDARPTSKTHDAAHDDAHPSTSSG